MDFLIHGIFMKVELHILIVITIVFIYEFWSTSESCHDLEGLTNMSFNCFER